MGQDLAGAREPGRRRLSREGRPAEAARCDRVQPGRLRLHHLHRQLGPARAGDLEGDQRERHHRRRRAVGQPQLRGPRQPRRSGQLPRLAAAGGRLRARRLGDQGSVEGADRHGQRRQARHAEGHLAFEPGGAGLHRPEHHARPVHVALCRRVQGRRQLAEDQDGAEPDLRMELGLDLRAEPALLRRHHQDAGPRHRRRRRAHSGAARRQDHHRPHLAGRLDQEGEPGRCLPARASGAAGRLQPVRHASRQSRGDDARHVRQHPHQECDEQGCGGPDQGRRQHHPLSVGHR